MDSKDPRQLQQTQQTPVSQGVNIKDGQEGLSALVARELEVEKEAWDAYMQLMRSRELHLQSTGSHPNKKVDVNRKSIFFLPVLSPYHPVSASWSVFMLLVDLAYTAFWVPLGVAFCTESYGDPSSACTRVDLAGGCVYALHVLLSFQCGIILRHKYKRTKVLDGPQLARLYIQHGYFWLDALAVVPFIYLIVLVCMPGHLQHAPATSWVGILSLCRLLRLLRLISLSKVVASNTLSGRYQEMMARYISVTTLYVLMLLYVLAVIVNLEACLVILIAYMEGVDNSWLTSVSWEDFTTVGPSYQWYAAIYWVITTSTTTGYGDFVPHSTVEQVFANLYMVGGMVMFGLLVGTVANMLTRASASAAQLYRFRKKMAAVGVWLQQYHIPEHAQQQVKDYFSDVWVLRNEGSLDAEVFSDLPTTLRQKVAQYITMDLLAQVQLFSWQDDGLQALVAAALRPVDVVPGHDICRQGEEADRLWICASGELQATQHAGAEPTFPRTPCLLGETVVLADEVPAARSRPWSVRAMGAVKLWELRSTDLALILRMYPSLKQELLQHITSQLLAELDAGGAHTTGPGHGSALGGTWCESVASIAPALHRQSKPVRDAAVQELHAAQVEDGSLQVLLDGLLEFSCLKAQRITLLPDAPSGHLMQSMSSSRAGHGNPWPQSGTQLPAQVTPSGTAASTRQGVMEQVGSSESASATESQPAGGTGACPAATGQASSQHACLPTCACQSCGRTVCVACKQHVRHGDRQHQTSGARIPAGTPEHVETSPFLAGISHADCGRSPRTAATSQTATAQHCQPGQHSGQSQHSSVLLSSLGLPARAAAQAAWRPTLASRASVRFGGISRSSMLGRASLNTTSIPVENFGDGYVLQSARSFIDGGLHNASCQHSNVTKKQEALKWNFKT